VRGTDQFHIGVVVDDLDGAMVELTEIFGYEWCAPLAVQTPVVLPDREMLLDLRFTYSAAAPRVELVQAVPDTLWVPAPGSGIHHAGYWSDDLSADSALLEARGYLTEAKGVRPDGTPAWAYHRSTSGPRIELVSRQLQPGMEQYWASGR
jgi:Glyoxalase/Bleomycin resistance protein/Dioxygenase superfamily